MSADAAGEELNGHPAWKIPAFLHELQLNEPELLGELIQLYIQDASENIRQLKGQLMKEDQEAVSATLHALKGSSRQIGGLILGDILAEMEEHLSAGDVAMVRGSLPGLHSAFQALCSEMEEQVFTRKEAKIV